MRIGFGYDIHRLVLGRSLILGGVTIPWKKGEAGHSDGDVLTHAVIDALLGAAGLGDIGVHFPPSDPKWKNADSLKLLDNVMDMMSRKGFRLINLDCVVVLEQPKISPHSALICRKLAERLNIDPDRISVKGKTGEKTGAVGRKRAVESYAVVLIEGDQPPAIMA